MKSFVAAIVILIIIISGMFFYINALENVSDELNGLISKVEKQVQNEKWEDVEQSIKEMSESFNKVKKWLPCLVEHDIIDEINVTVAKVEQYALYKEVPELMAEITALKEQTEHIAKRERLIIENLL